MRQTIEKVWDLLDTVVIELNKKHSNIILDKSTFRTFNKIFRSLYNEIKKQYMDINVKNLDRHKVAGIIIVSIIKSDAVRYNGNINDGNYFIGQYLAAVSTGISFMQDNLNNLLIQKNEDIIKKLWFPKPLSCDTPYFEIFCRNLYYANNNNQWGLNPLEIAEKLFLLEYISVEKQGINPEILKDTTYC